MRATETRETIESEREWKKEMETGLCAAQASLVGLSFCHAARSDTACTNLFRTRLKTQRAMASIQKYSLDELCTWINIKIDGHEEKMDGGCKLMIRALVAEIMRKLAQNDGSYEQAFQWWAVGVDPSNRYGVGLDPERVHKLIVAIFAAGFVWEETTNAVAMEIDPNDKKKEDIDMNIQLAIDSNDMLPPVDPDKIKILTLSNGHTTAGLGCFGHGVKVVMEELQFLCQDSRLSLAKLRELQPAYAEAVDKGAHI